MFTIGVTAILSWIYYRILRKLNERQGIDSRFDVN
jgi:hypothetical protein